MKTVDNVLLLKEIMTVFGLNQSDMAKRIGIHQTNVSAILRGERSCGDSIMTKVAKAFPEISKDWLLTGEGNMFADEQSKQKVMEKTVKQRLMEFLYFKGISQSRFERLCGMSNGYINNLKKSLGAEKLQNILKAFPELNTEWLLYGEGEMLKSTPAVQQLNTYGDNNYNNGVMQIGPARAELCPQCGGNTVPSAYIKIPDRIIYAPETNVTEWVEDNLDACERIDFLEMLDPRTLKVQRINTRAMEPWISEGAYLFTRYIPEWKRLLFDGTLYGIDLDYPHMIIRRVYDDGENIKCVPINPDYAPITVPRERVLGVYEIVASLKMLKKTL